MSCLGRKKKEERRKKKEERKKNEERRKKKKERRKKNAPTETGPLPQSHAQDIFFFVNRVRGNPSLRSKRLQNTQNMYPLLNQALRRRVNPRHRCMDTGTSTTVQLQLQTRRSDECWNKLLHQRPSTNHVLGCIPPWAGGGPMADATGSGT